MDTAFEWVDFALQPPGAVVECLDAAGIDGCVPGHAAGEDTRPAQGADAD
ncbi:hypothetical protein ACFONC_12800 [Luteimonas soli]|uniref:Uncharacterized protein n=1 Tax=Luteimonas soli TaxID=1648966 RepID=A0ABV7XLX4_9GAMM